MGAENRGDTFCEDRTEVALELRRGRERKSSIRPPVASLPDLERLDGTGRQLGAMLAAQKLQQDGDALVGGLRIARLALAGPIKPPSIAAHDVEHEKVRSKQARFTRAAIDHLNGE